MQLELFFGRRLLGQRGARRQHGHHRDYAVLDLYSVPLISMKIERNGRKQSIHKVESVSMF